MNNTPLKSPLNSRLCFQVFIRCVLHRTSSIVQDHLKSATERAELYKHLKRASSDERYQTITDADY